MFDLPKVTKYSVEQFELCEGKVKLVVAISLLKMKKPEKHEYHNRSRINGGFLNV